MLRSLWTRSVGERNASSITSSGEVEKTSLILTRLSQFSSPQLIKSAQLIDRVWPQPSCLSPSDSTAQFMKRSAASQRLFVLQRQHAAPNTAAALLQVALRRGPSPPPPVSSLFTSLPSAPITSPAEFSLEIEATHAFFYGVSVAACDSGAGLGAQVIERSLLNLQLDTSLPSLSTFQTVSPIPGVT
jgi:hypothetical protein